MTESPIYAPPPAQYSHINGPPLEIPAETLQALQALADDASEPGRSVTVSDLVNGALASYLADKSVKKKLAAIAAQADADELARVEALHGGEAA